MLSLSALALLLFSTTAFCQLYEVNLDEKVNASTLIAEGRVIGQKCFWNQAHTMIYTANTIQLYKTFKGTAGFRTIEVLTQGGSVGNRCVVVSDLLTLNINQVGVFFCFENAVNLTSPTTGKVRFTAFSKQKYPRLDFKQVAYHHTAVTHAPLVSTLQSYENRLFL